MLALLLKLLIGLTVIAVVGCRSYLPENAQACDPEGGVWDAASQSCVCRKHFAGERCETVLKCIHGTLFNGECVCQYGWHGRLCEKIRCFHGVPTYNETSCQCKPSIAGMYCDACRDRERSRPPLCQPLLTLNKHETQRHYQKCIKAMRQPAESPTCQNFSFLTSLSYCFNAIVVLAAVAYYCQRGIPGGNIDAREGPEELSHETHAPTYLITPKTYAVLPSYEELMRGNESSRPELARSEMLDDVNSRSVEPLHESAEPLSTNSFSLHLEVITTRPMVHV